jgi:penicillin-binding protein 1C
VLGFLSRRRGGSVLIGRRWRRVARVLAALALLLLGLGAVGVALAPDPAELLSPARATSIEVVDRHGQLLRLVPDGAGERVLPVDPERVSPHLIEAVLAAEDQRFFYHPGVDPFALLRAAWQDLSAGRIVSGGSTLTMQLARIIAPRPRGLRAKLAQIALAVRLELAMSKRELLGHYLGRAPMGSRVIGFEAAARVYLGKPASQLSPAEAALLAAIPRSPSLTNPWRGRAMLSQRRDWILDRMRTERVLDEVAWQAARSEPVVLADDPLRYPAPHFLARVLDEVAAMSAVKVVSSLEPALQQRVEVAVRRQLDALANHGVGSIAVVILDLERDEWLAIEGSGGFWDRPGGQIDGSRRARQPGSALKPFTYAAAFDRGLSPAAVLPDLPRSFPWADGTWTPRNYDGLFHGPLLARSALACSVNVPAAFVLGAIGPDTLLDELRAAGVTTLRGDASIYGLGLTLGAGEVRLDELVGAYGALLRGGVWRPAHAWRAVIDARGEVRRRPHRQLERRVCTVEAAAQVTDILADPEARAPAFGVWSVLRLPFPAAVKTGTSEGFRDNWCIGGTRSVVVGVWAGNFDRAAMGNVSGVAGAGTVWREAMLAWAEVVKPHQEAALQRPLVPNVTRLQATAVCSLSGLAPGPDCQHTTLELLAPSQTPARRCDWHHRRADGALAVRWPALYRAWAVDEALLTRTDAIASAANEPASDDASAHVGIVVTAPASGDAFVISPELPRRYQSIELRCAVAAAGQEVVWLVDGVESMRTVAPFSARWQLTGGRHRIAARAGKRVSAPVEITVYGS